MFDDGTATGDMEIVAAGVHDLFQKDKLRPREWWK